MSSLKHIDRVMLERFLDMGSGYVCDFSNRTFSDFVVEAVGVDIDDPKYGDGSKANRLRAFWHLESDAKVATLLRAMLDYWQRQKQLSSEGISSADVTLLAECEKILAKLSATSLVEDPDAFKPNSSDETFALLAASIQESIGKGEPELALDRLHTFMMKWVRELCNKHGILFEQSTRLHKMLKNYSAFLKGKGLLQSEMAVQILSSSGQMLDAFDNVRNTQSLAHDNKLLNKNESRFIFNGVSNIVRFLEFVEGELEKGQGALTHKEAVWTDMEYTDEEIEAAGDRWMQHELDVSRGK